MGQNKQSSKTASNIPHIVHQTWKTHEIPYDIYRREWVHSWSQHHPEWQHWFWTDVDNRQLVQAEYPWFLETYDALPVGVMKADAVRYLYMHRYGGVYTDLDSECYTNIEPLLTGDIVLGKLNTDLLTGDAVPNAFLASTAGHPFWLEVVAEIQGRWLAGAVTKVEELSGPTLLTDIVCRRYGQYQMTIHPSVYIYPIDWRDHSVAHETLRSPHRSFVKTLHPEAYMANYWTHNWTDVLSQTDS